MANNQDVTILESIHVNDVLKHCTYNSLVAFDLDNTVIRPTHVEDLGSDQWFVNLFKYAIDILSDQEQARLLALALTDYIQGLIDVKSVDRNTPNIIKRLQDVKIPVLGLTARSISISDATFNQLNQVEIGFTTYPPSKKIRLDVSDYPDREVYYQDGIIFCDGADKGKCLIEFFKMKKLKHNVVMVDDVKKNLLRVEEAVTQFGLSFFGLRYGKTDERVSQYEMSRSVTKLLSMTDRFSSAEKEIITKLRLEEFTNQHFSVKVSQ